MKTAPLDVPRFEQLKASGDLPSPKGVALAIMRLAQRDDASMADLARVIRTDPAFVGRLIKAANGLIGYCRRPVSSVQDALTVLGLPAVRTMALGFSLLTNYRNGACEAFDYGRYWSASLVSAIAIQAITSRTRVAAPDETYCVGLLACIGKLALATLYPVPYSEVISESQGKDPRLLLELETRAFAMNHAELGAAMLADWGLPLVFTDAIYAVATGTEFSPAEGSRTAVLAQSLVIARQMASMCLAEEAGRSHELHRLLMVASRLSFDEETVAALTDGVIAEWVEWGALLDVSATPLPAFSELSKQSDVQTGGDTKTLGRQVPAAADARDPGTLPRNIAAKGGAEVVAEPPDVDPPRAPEKAAQVCTGNVSAADKVRVMRVLLVEHDEAVRRNIKEVLQAGKFDVAEVHDGYSAAEFALDYLPDMMIIRARLPDAAAEDVIKTLRMTRIGRSVYVVVLAAGCDEDTVVAMLEAGADDVLPTPVNGRLLLAKIGAGRRMTCLHREIEKDREDIRHFAAELSVSNRRLREVALQDPLTGFPNRRHFVERLNQEWGTSTRYGRSICCLVLDIDNFKHINDTFGHDVGDTVLRQVATAIRSALRTQDVTARLGGDEFVILCPDTSTDSAMVCAERVRSCVEEAHITSGEIRLGVTVSVGVAARDKSVSDPDVLMKLADQGLYLAKQSGRNRAGCIQLR